MEGAPATPPTEGYACPTCGARFLPFLPVIACPGCGHETPGDGAIVDDALRVYTENLRVYGRPIPPVIRIENLRDDYLYRALFFLKALDERGPEEDEDAVIRRSLDVITSASGPGWRAHVDAYYRAVLDARRGRSEREK